MKNYCYLDVPNFREISEQVYKHVVTNYDLPKLEFWTTVDHNALCRDVPLLKKVFDDLGIGIQNAAIIKTVGECPIHVDYYDPRIGVSPPRVLWPVKNCDGSKTNFFHVEREWLEERRLPNGIPYFHIHHDQPLTQTDSFELKQPAVINPNEAHNVVCNPSNRDYRISLTIGTTESLSSFLS